MPRTLTKSERDVKRENIPKDPVVILNVLEHRPLSDELIEEYNLASKITKRKNHLNVDDPVPYEPLPKLLKIHEMIYHLLVLDLDIGNDSVPWSFTDASKKFEWHTMIQKHELFPYFLYKAVWDDDFPAILWGEHAQGETIIVNFELLFLIAKGHGNKDDRTPYYVDNYGPSDSMNNRLQHNLVNIFGFNDMGCQNFEDERQVNSVYHNNHEFFEMTDRICEENGLAPIGRWQEFHHSDFFQGDNPHIEDRHRPKRKNSKFFKICQTLKSDYRVRKAGLETIGHFVEPRPHRGRPVKHESKYERKFDRVNQYRFGNSGAEMNGQATQVYPEVVPITY